MSEFASVLELAQEVAKEANRIKQGAAAELNADRVLKRVDEANEALTRLSLLVRAARRLAEASSEESLDLSGLDDGRDAFIRNVERAGGLPSNQAFDGAKNKINGVARRVTAELAAAWTQWADREVARVPTVRISLLDQQDQKTAHDRWASLVKTSKVSTPTVTDIVSLKSDLDYLHDWLDSLPDPPGAVLGILERLAQRPALTLADLADDEIAALREAGIADQIEVRRRGGA
jgi:hypothetical protein